MTEPLPLHLKPSLTVAEAAALLSISERQVNRLLQSGALPRVKIGHLTRIRREALDAYLANNEERAEPFDVDRLFARGLA